MAQKGSEEETKTLRQGGTMDGESRKKGKKDKGELEQLECTLVRGKSED